MIIKSKALINHKKRDRKIGQERLEREERVSKIKIHLDYTKKNAEREREKERELFEWNV